mmetsp:Transcript_126036/g.368274  ORF Transcript_126036/g.368274 Transcript_126036/m.368274 type:complete len:561 (+) Transcript_126036:56-1738(+)
MLELLCILPLLASASNSFGKKFLEGNKGRDGVITLPSGLQYKVLRAGTGSDHPTLSSPCSCHYEGRTAEKYPSGQKFDSSYDRGSPSTFAPDQVIRGWTIAMQLMVEGDKWEMYIPSELAYGDQGRPPKIPGGSVLVFTMELVKIKGGKTPAEKKQTEAAAAPAVAETASKEPAPKSAPAPSNRVVFNVANLVGEPSEASFTLEIHPEWAPLGARRVQELVQANFFDGVRFFRVIDGFMAQFGIHGDPSVMRRWGDKKIKDDPKVPGVGNKRGRVSFAMAGPNTRSTQFFISFVDNDSLDGMGFAPIAEVVEGMDVVDRLFKVGEGAPSGPGPSQGLIQARGNAYLEEHFPKLSYVKSCRAVGMDDGKSRLRGSDAAAQPTEPVVQDFGDGLQLRVTQAGDGKTFPRAGDLLTMHYTLTLAADTSGKVIDSSRSRNEPFTFTIGRGQVIRGWDQGVMKMSLGQRGVLSVPSALGYGKRGAGGAIPPNADLRFDVEVLGIGDKFSPAGLAQSSGFGLKSVIAILAVAVLIAGACFWAARGTPAEKDIRRTIEMSIGKSAAE